MSTLETAYNDQGFSDQEAESCLKNPLIAVNNFTVLILGLVYRSPARPGEGIA